MRVMTSPTQKPADDLEARQNGAPRDRLLATAAELFYREGIHGVGVDRILREAAITRATMYRHFAGKEDLVLAYLQGEDAYLRGLFEEAAAQIDDPQQLVDAVIAGIAADVGTRHDRGCPFINAAAEYPDAQGPVRQLISRHREWFRGTLEHVATAAGLAAPDEVAASLVMLRDAALVGGYLDGDERVGPAFERTAKQIVGR